MMKRLILVLAAHFLLPPLDAAEEPPPPFEIDEQVVSHLAVQEKGRVKPMTTLTRENLILLSGKADWRPSESGPRWSANQVLLSLWLDPKAWDGRNLILVDHAPLRDAAGLDHHRKQFSFRELSANTEIARLVREAAQLQAADKDAHLTNLQKEARAVANRLQLYNRWQAGEVAIVPHPSRLDGGWQPVHTAHQASLGIPSAPFAGALEGMRQAMAKGDASAFHRQMDALARQLRETSPSVYPARSALEFELFYQEFHPFRWAAWFYGAALVVLALTFGWRQREGYALGWLLVIVGFAFQITGFTMRVIISGRPPVTNMYETVIWVAAIVVLFAIILEAIYRSRYLLLAATPAAILSLILADAQPTVLDPAIHPLVPVLRHNTWLIIHVLTIVSSYAAFLLALVLGHIAIVRRWFGASDRDAAPVDFYVYRAVQIGVLLLAVGTVLGGVWANYSWGRFWDWDPKETWALVSLLCYLAVLHGRLAGWWGGFGISFGAILCFQAILMAWYGVNFVLGEGLHSYGRGTGGFGFAAIFVLTEAGFLATSLFLRFRSHSPLPAQAAIPKESKVLAHKRSLPLKVTSHDRQERSD
jgi:ABC-type transport system involved in cytochrome c biogenesis permease subunit